MCADGCTLGRGDPSRPLLQPAPRARRERLRSRSPERGEPRERATTSRTLCFGTDMKLFSRRKPIADQINVLELDPVEAAVAAPALHMHVDVAYHLESQLIVIGWASPGVTV